MKQLTMILFVVLLSVSALAADMSTTQSPPAQGSITTGTTNVSADVRNINLTAVAASGVSGSASTLSSSYGGVTPHTHVEINARLNQLPATGKVYQAWLIDNDSSMRQSLGLFEGSNLHVSMLWPTRVSGSPWDSFAVSLEPADDTDPAPGTIVAQGNVPSTTVAASDFPSMVVLPAGEPLMRDLAIQRFGLTATQINELRMRGLSYSTIELVANVASRCSRPLYDVVSQYMESGGSLDQIASTCNTTVASLLTPAPMMAVAGFQGEVTSEVSSGVMMPLYYKQFPNGRPVISVQQWQLLNQQGNSWRDIAVAANVSAQTGESVEDLLRMTRVQGQTWTSIAVTRGLHPADIMDVSQWPFTQATGPMTRSERQMERERYGAMSTQPAQPLPGVVEPMPSEPNAPSAPTSSGPSY